MRKRFGMRHGCVPVRIERSLLEIEDEDIQSALCRHLGVKLTQRSCRRISRIGQERLPFSLACGVEPLKHAARHIDLTAHGQIQGLGKLQRDREDGLEILRHVLADKTVASRCALHENALLVAQGDRKAVDFGLHRIDGVRKRLAHTGVKGLQLLKGKDVRERVHLHGVRHLFKLIQRLAAHSLRRRGGVKQLGVLSFKGQELRVHSVVFVIRDLGVVVHVVALCVVRDLRAQLADPLVNRVHLALSFSPPKKGAHSSFIIPIFPPRVNANVEFFSRGFRHFQQIVRGS